MSRCHWVETDRELQLDRDPNDVRGRDDYTRERDGDPRDVFVAGLELPRGPEREVVLEATIATS
jgi:hypothetical protein